MAADDFDPDAYLEHIFRGLSNTQRATLSKKLLEALKESPDPSRHGNTIGIRHSTFFSENSVAYPENINQK
jgi:hypothetical protein